MTITNNKEKPNLLLITSGFPYGESERSFIAAEFAEMQKHFNINILAVTKTAEIKYPLPAVKRIEHAAMPGLNETSFIELVKIALLPAVRTEIKKAMYHSRANIVKKRTGQIIAAWYQSSWIEPIIKKIVDEDKIDLIYTYWCRPFTLAALHIKESFSGLKVVTRFHGIDLFNERIEGNWQPFREYISAHCDRLIFVAEASKEYFLKQWKATDPEKYKLAYLGCPSYGLLPIKETASLIIVSCANAVALKRIDLIIEALALLPEEIEVRWFHFGDGTELESLKKKSNLQLTERKNIMFKFMGFMPNAKLIEEYKEIAPQLMITTSSSEGGVPVSLQEAFSMGIPAIGTDIGGISEIIKDGHTGYLLPASPSAEQVSEAIIKYSELPLAQKQAMSQAAYTLWQEKFDAQRNAESFVLSIKEVIYENNAIGDHIE